MELFRPIIKDPDAVRTYGIAWGDNLVPGDTLASVSWGVPAGMAVVSEGINDVPVSDDGRIHPVGTVALVRLSGGTAGADHACVCRIATVAGDVDERTLLIAVRER